MASMERQLQRQDQPINMTAALEALSPLLNNPRRTVILVEGFTSGVMALLLLQLVLGSYRRQTSGYLVQGITWVTYNLSFPAIAYTLGLMQSSPVKNVMYPIWAISLLLAAGCTNTVKVYELGDNKKWMRSFFNYYQYLIYTLMICWLLLPVSLNLKEYLYDVYQYLAPSKYFAFVKNVKKYFVFSSLALIIMITSFLGRELACVLVEFGYSCTGRVAKFMNNLPATDDGFDPASMRGYKYPVHFKILGEDNVITIDQIWQCEGSLLLSPGSTDHKDVCLAYAMYQLLKRRYYGMACAEEHLAETRDFVFKGLLRGTDDDYERAFRIVEVELGFCHDFFFTKHAIIFELETGFFLLFVLRTILILVVAYFVCLNPITVKTPTAIIEVRSRRADNIITILVLGTILLIELLQAAFYMASDWCKVSVACRYVAGSWYQDSAFFEKLMGHLSRFTIFGHWKNTIDQYRVLFPNLTAADESDLRAVKLAIVSTLRSCDGQPTNGEWSLRRNGVFAEFSWALQGQPHAEVMIIWHIATEHVDATSTNEVEEEETEFHRHVSVSLSRYCAYLMGSAPQLLPGYFGDTRSAMDGVKKDVIKVAISRGGLRDREEDRSILMTGVKLGKQLEGIADPWKLLADFWTEKILYVAPSDNVKAHMERLANGGEFLTHIWALLTHAGIHKINREEERNTMPGQPSQASV